MDVLLVVVHVVVFIIVLSNGARFDEILVEYLQNCEQVFCEEFYLEVVEICDKKILKCVNEWKQYYNCMKSCVRNEIAQGPKYIDLEEVMEKKKYQRTNASKCDGPFGHWEIDAFEVTFERRIVSPTLRPVHICRPDWTKQAFRFGSCSPLAEVRKSRSLHDACGRVVFQ
ncbi:Adenylosuccinate synthetase [Trichinella spiralis]|uniref:Adenylosuccinate synthetase n=1 Tax=Trichinella spiralis TaxID=6334 RepID=A0ABR3L0P1_TRISP